MGDIKESTMEEIIALVTLLRHNGDKVLSASSKLSLSTSLLFNLNEAFSLIVYEPDMESSFQVCNSSKIDVFRDLKFLHDFVQKTVGLKLTHSGDQTVDISKFRHLKYLELKKVCVEKVKGLQAVRGQLESVVCAGRQGVCSIGQLLASCGGDAGIGFVWGSLRHLALPHNALENLDSSLELAPWLQILDLSHNLLISTDQLFCLPNLKYVNLGYNRLETVPVFNTAALHSLQVLVLKNNYIDNINGLQGLECLTELDLSYNCLTEHSTLWPLEKMSNLQWITLEGNPLSYHRKHRLLSIKYLPPRLSDTKFVLDRLPLSRSEWQILSEKLLFTMGSNKFPSKELVSSVSNSLSESTHSEISARNQEVDMERSLSKKKKYVKEAIITEDEGRKEARKEESLSSSYLETSKDHLETKKQILALRKRFGEDNWLSSHAGTFVQDIMGIQPSSSTVFSSTPTAKSFDMNAISLENESTIQADESTCTNETLIPENADSNVEGRSQVLNDEEKSEDLTLVNDSIEEIPVNTCPESPYDSEEDTGNFYLVQKRKNANELEELFLVITSDDIKERDAITRKTKYSWSTGSVLSCVLGRGEPVTVEIIFDTARVDRQNRRYFVELDDAKEIVTVISERMRNRTLSLKIFKCMKCSTHFSQDADSMTIVTTSSSVARQLKCPTCESTLVFETDELSTPDVENDTGESSAERLRNQQMKTTKNNLQHSESFSSIGGTEGGAITAATQSTCLCLVLSDSHTHKRVCCSATSLEESRESTPSTNALNKKYESDIEILSNPSQSSIEVLDEASRAQLTPHRKRSSEERRTAVAPSLLTIPDAAPIMTGLTESSSSGSLTDSICTAYENKIIKQTNNSDDKSNSERDVRFTSVTNLTSMLGGLLQSIKIGSNKPLLSKMEEVSQFLGADIKYSYTDFGSIDHRIKLHIILNVFEHENEELVLLLRADIVMHTIKDTFPGCLVLSTSKTYILRIDGYEGEDPQRWLHKEVSWTMDRLRCFAPLPFKQGVLIELEQPSKINEGYSTINFLCILQDFQRTSNFLFYITDLSLPPSCEVQFSIPDHCTDLMHDLLKTSKNYQDEDAVRLLALFSSGILKYEDVNIQLKLSGLIVTASLLIILMDNVRWLLPGSNQVPIIAREQVMSNLIGIEHYGTSLTLNFLDEVAGLEESWTLHFVSVSAAETVINSVQPPWEELFSIPLQITTHKPLENENA